MKLNWLPSSTLGRNMLLLATIFLLGQAGVYLLFHAYVLTPAAQRFGQLLWQTDLALNQAKVRQELDSHFQWRPSVDSPGRAPRGYFLRETARAFAAHAPGAELRVSRNGARRDVLWIRSGGKQRWLGIGSPLMRFGSDEFMLMRLGVILAVTLLGAWLMVRQINRPLADLAQRAKNMNGIFTNSDTWPSVGGPSEVKHLEQAIVGMCEDLRRLHQEQKLLLTGISHELRTPLSRVLLSIQLPEAKWSEEKEAMIADIEEMDATIGKFLTWVRADVGEKVKEIMVHPWITEMIKIAEEKYKLKILCLSLYSVADGVFLRAQWRWKVCLEFSLIMFVAMATDFSICECNVTMMNSV